MCQWCVCASSYTPRCARDRLLRRNCGDLIAFALRLSRVGHFAPATWRGNASWNSGIAYNSGIHNSGMTYSSMDWWTSPRPGTSEKVSIVIIVIDATKLELESGLYDAPLDFHPYSPVLQEAVDTTTEERHRCVMAHLV